MIHTPRTDAACLKAYDERGMLLSNYVVAVAKVADQIEKWVLDGSRPDEWILKEWVQILRNGKPTAEEVSEQVVKFAEQLSDESNRRRALELELGETRTILAGSDISSLPNDYPLSKMAHDRMKDIAAAEDRYLSAVRGRADFRTALREERERHTKGRRSPLAGTLEGGSPHIVARDANPGGATPGGVVPVSIKLSDHFTLSTPGPNPYYTCLHCGKDEPGVENCMQEHLEKHHGINPSFDESRRRDGEEWHALGGRTLYWSHAKGKWVDAVIFEMELAVRRTAEAKEREEKP